MDKNLTIAISCDEHKLASLFFDRVIPVGLSSYSVPKSICFDKLWDWVGDPKLREDIQRHGLESEIKLGFESELEETNDTALDNFYMGFIRFVTDKYSFNAVPLFKKSTLYHDTYANGNKDVLDLSIIDAPIIDPSKLEWDQILEVRKDKNFKHKLRRFRFMLCDNYQDKDPQYIREHLIMKVLDYEEACKKHGLELIVSSLSQLLDSKSLLGTLGLTATSILMGEPAFASTTAITGAILEFGKISLHVAKKKLEFASAKERSAIAILIELRTKMKHDVST